MNLMLRLLAVLLLLWMTPVNAALDPGELYAADVAVEGRDEAERVAAYAEALSRVLVKVVGDRTVATRPVLQPLLAQAPSLVEQYGYRTTDSGLRLWVRFAREPIDTALREAGIPVWGGVRPPVLAWVVAESGGSRHLLSRGGVTLTDDPMVLEAVAALQSEAVRRGLPLRLPLLDLEDQARIQPADVWGDFRERIREASRRYQTEAILTGRMARVGGSWHGRWVLYQGEQRQEWEGRHADPHMVVAMGVDGASDALAARYARFQEADGTALFQIRVVGVTTLVDLHDASRYLERLAPMVRLEPVVVEPDAVVFRATVRGGAAALQQAIAGGNRLQQQRGDTFDGPVYRYLP